MSCRGKCLISKLMFSHQLNVNNKLLIGLVEIKCYVHTNTNTHTRLNKCLACGKYSISDGYYDYSLYGVSPPQRVLEGVSRDRCSLHLLQNSWALGAYLEQQVQPHWNVHRGPAGHPFQSICGTQKTECEDCGCSIKILPFSREEGQVLWMGLSDIRAVPDGR